MPPAETLPAPRRGCVGRGLTSSEAAPAPIACEYALDADGLPGSPPRRPLAALGAFWRSVSVRIGLVSWLLSMLCFGAAGVFFYQTFQQRLIERIDSSIADRLASIEAEFGSGGIDAVVAMATERERLPMQTSMGFHLSDGGERIAGNVPSCPRELGWTVVRGSALGLEGDESLYRFLTTRLGDYELSLGRSLYALEELRSVALNCLLWTLAASTLLAIAASVLLARRMQQRLSGMREAIARVATGDLDARIPPSGRCDDIDEMAARINVALERLSRSVDGMHQVSTDIAHDLKTPLNRLSIQLQELSDRADRGDCDAEVFRQALDEALDEARGIDATFEALLRIAQIEAGARRARFEAFDLRAVLEMVAEIYEPVVEEHCQGLRLAIEPGAAPLTLHGDRELVTQLLVNLVENAIHHCDENVEIAIAAGRRTDGHGSGRVWLAVADSGPGIPEAERERVFRRLYRLERSRTTRGTGLGLSLVKAVADLHGGEVRLEDNAPGLRVVVRFAEEAEEAATKERRDAFGGRARRDRPSAPPGAAPTVGPSVGP